MSCASQLLQFLNIRNLMINWAKVEEACNRRHCSTRVLHCLPSNPSSATPSIVLWMKILQEMHPKNKMRECPVQHAKKNIFIRFTTGFQRSLSLNGIQVHCSQYLESCEWKGELGQLDNRLNLSPQAKLVNS